VEKNPADNGKNPPTREKFRPLRNKAGRRGVDQEGGIEPLFQTSPKEDPK
jgi:hypothetical protein